MSLVGVLGIVAGFIVVAMFFVVMARSLGVVKHCGFALMALSSMLVVCVVAALITSLKANSSPAYNSPSYLPSERP